MLQLLHRGRQCLHQAAIVCNSCNLMRTFTALPFTRTQRNFQTDSVYLQKNKTEPEIDLQKNPYYEKYTEKLKGLQETDPEIYSKKLEELKESLKPKAAPAVNPKTKEKVQKKPTEKKTVPKLVLNDIVKLELLRQETPENIEKIWMQFHSVKDCVYGVIKEMDYDEVMSKAKLCPSFVYPLPRQDGYEFFYQQFSGSEIYFTPVALYKKHQENAPPCVTMQHFTDLKEEKGLVLMSGDYDSKILDKANALNLARQLTMFYGRNAAERFTLVRIFNYMPQKFNYNDLITEYKGCKKFLESSIIECS
ncbi:ATP synthase mitochondrial F1 complex assembly factor 1 [Octopus sinensis]|uniref:ATP synthase mitochondrial F1 complex assembly factor 1 n=1 Tax=Octopus sinensis TaxID=2607531 RepID=A0A6P7T1X5_9MOLL|nr:ATP synthase mitochondrial F1 complex assembly factor 1 [Octopus sinensis]XP_036364300.1 ATP synthase mitochondrial F1 complex assembly factor 1 [Octopus sinensis]XP_036364301.1 ATP synthase mitochondrial F1 complex assembly factor 1 [Octopus sinensis]XP_036364302.1 ATP synthase mitochondrial F1 complex assembly factor 1 [Octopus sinensis]